MNNKLGNSKKDIIVPSGGFFLFPEDLKGKQKIKDRKFLIFYFDTDEEYSIVKEMLEKRSNSKKSHPNMDSSKLIQIIKQYGKK